MSTVKSYVKQVLAKLTGDENKVVAEKNYRKAVSSVNQQIGGLENRKVDLESVLEEAIEKLDNAKYPKELINNTSLFTKAIIEAQAEVDAAKAELEGTEDSLAYFKSLAVEFDKTEAEA